MAQVRTGTSGDLQSRAGGEQGDCTTERSWLRQGRLRQSWIRAPMSNILGRGGGRTHSRQTKCLC
jgi:hypothetical protein